MRKEHNNMTGPEIEKLESELNQEYYGDDPRFPTYLKKPLSEADKKTFEEITCRKMINSCLAYGSDPFKEFDTYWYKHGYCSRSYMSDYIDALGEDEVKRIYDEQATDFAKAKVQHAVYVDAEGCEYNSIEW